MEATASGSTASAIIDLEAGEVELKTSFRLARSWRRSGTAPSNLFLRIGCWGAAPDYHRPNVSFELAFTQVTAQDSAGMVPLDVSQVGGS